MFVNFLIKILRKKISFAPPNINSFAATEFWAPNRRTKANLGSNNRRKTSQIIYLLSGHSVRAPFRTKQWASFIIRRIIVWHCVPSHPRHTSRQLFAFNVIFTSENLWMRTTSRGWAQVEKVSREGFSTLIQHDTIVYFSKVSIVTTYSQLHHATRQFPEN